MNQLRKGFILPVIVAIVAILGIGAVVYFAPSKNTAEAPVVDVVDTSDWKTCINKKYSYEVKYPATWNVWEKDSGGPFFPSSCDSDNPLVFSPSSKSSTWIMIEPTDVQGGSIFSNCNSVYECLSRAGLEYNETSVADGNGLFKVSENTRVLYSFMNKYFYTIFIHIGSSDNVSVIKTIISTLKFTTPKTEEPIACTMDAYMCPGGSYVGRSGPKCEFVCPTRLNLVQGNEAKIGQTVVIDHIQITPLEVIEDSRCPVDVTCIWAGAVKLKVGVTIQDGPFYYVLTLNQPYTVGSVKSILLTEVKPAKRSSKISASEYSFIFSVSDMVKTLEYSIVKDGYFGGYETKENMVINKESDFKELWYKAFVDQGSGSSIPAIDFSKKTVLAVFMGLRNSGGNSVEIDRIEDDTSSVKVYVKYMYPGGNCPTTPVMTTPSQVVSTNKITKPVEFIEINQPTYCKSY